MVSEYKLNSYFWIGLLGRAYAPSAPPGFATDRAAGPVLVGNRSTCALIGTAPLLVIRGSTSLYGTPTYKQYAQLE